jgi:hypothetical protein
MLKIEVSFKCCCDDVFKKVYGGLIRDIKKQVGKKKLGELSITLNETCHKQTFHFKSRRSVYNPHICAKCSSFYSQVKRETVPVSQYDIKIEG